MGGSSFWGRESVGQTETIDPGISHMHHMYTSKEFA